MCAYVDGPSGIIYILLGWLLSQTHLRGFLCFPVQEQHPQSERQRNKHKIKCHSLPGSSRNSSASGSEGFSPKTGVNLIHYFISQKLEQIVGLFGQGCCRVGELQDRGPSFALLRDNSCRDNSCSLLSLSEHSEIRAASSSGCSTRLSLLSAA